MNRLLLSLAALTALTAPACSLLFDGLAFRQDAGGGGDVPVMTCSMPSDCPDGMRCNPAFMPSQCTEGCDENDDCPGSSCIFAAATCAPTRCMPACRAGEVCEGTACVACDGDGDGFIPMSAPAACPRGPLAPPDCDDTDPAIHPFALPDCDEVSNDTCPEGRMAAAALGSNFELGYLSPAAVSADLVSSLHVAPLSSDEVAVGVAAAFRRGIQPGVVRVQLAEGPPPAPTIEDLPGWGAADPSASVLSAVMPIGSSTMYIATADRVTDTSIRRYTAEVTQTGIDMLSEEVRPMATAVIAISTHANPTAAIGGPFGAVIMFQNDMGTQLWLPDGMVGPRDPLLPQTFGFGGQGVWGFGGDGALDINEVAGAGELIDFEVLGAVGRAALGSWTDGVIGGSRSALAFGVTTTELRYFEPRVTMGGVPLPHPPGANPLLTAEAVYQRLYMVCYLADAVAGAGADSMVFALFNADSESLLGSVTVPLPAAESVTDLDIGVSVTSNAGVDRIDVAWAATDGTDVRIGAARVCRSTP